MILIKKKAIIEKNTKFDELILENVELREYKKKGEKINNNSRDSFIITIYIKTNKGVIEMDYIGKPIYRPEEFEEYYDFLCNYNGLSSALNRALIELNKK